MEKKYDLFHVILYFLLQIGIYIFSIFQLQEMTSFFAYLFVYSFPFILFYEGVYFKNIEYNYAQISKLLLLTFLIRKYDVFICYIFSILTWAHSVYRNIFFLQQEYSIIANDKNKKRDKIIKFSIYYLLNLITFATIFYVFHERLFECIVLFAINIFYLLILYSKSITYSPLFNIFDKDSNYFIPSSKIRFSIVDSLALFELLELVWVLPILGGILYLQCNILSVTMSLPILVVYIFQFAKNNISVYGKRIFSLYLPFIIQLFMTLLFIYVYKNYRILDSEKKINISSMIVSVISADLIFNFTAMFILMQENYNKYKSSYLLKNIVTKWTIFSSVIVPVIFIIILILDIIPEQFFIVYSIFCICTCTCTCTCISCSILLLNKLKRLLNTVNIIRVLMSNTNFNIVRSYCNGGITSDNDIDTILKILINAISNKEYTELKTVFELILRWIEKYRKEISISDYFPYFESQNKFYSFVDILITAIVESKSIVIIKQFADQIYEIIRFADIENEYRQYHIFYNSLNKLIQEILNVDNIDFENSAKQLVNLYFYKAGYILSKLTDSKRTEGFVVEETDDYRDFKTFYFEPLENTIRKSVNIGKYTFLRGVDLFSMFFRYVPKDVELNENHLLILHEITHTYSYVLRESCYNNELIGSVFSDYKSIIHYLSYLKMSDMLYELMSNVVFNSIREIYDALISRKYLFGEKDLEILYSYFFDEKFTRKDYKNFLSLFCIVVSTNFDYGLHSITKNNQNRIWGRMIQLKLIFEKENNDELLNLINIQIKKISGKHPQIITDYQQYEDSWEKAISSWNSYQEEFNEKYK